MRVGCRARSNLPINKKAPVSKSFLALARQSASFAYLAICRYKVLSNLVRLYQYRHGPSMVEMPGIEPGGNGLIVPYLHLPSPPTTLLTDQTESVNERNSNGSRQYCRSAYK